MCEPRSERAEKDVCWKYDVQRRLASLVANTVLAAPTCLTEIRARGMKGVTRRGESEAREQDCDVHNRYFRK